MSTDKTADILDWFLAEQNEERVPDGKFHPSSLWMCDRQAVMTARGEPQTNPPTAKNFRVFELGNILHALIQKAIESRYPGEFTPEFEIAMEWIAGHGDGMRITEGDEDGAVVYEFKSTRSLAKTRSAASDHHVKQGATYCVALAKSGVKIKELRVVYFEKTNLDIVEHVLPYDPRWEQMVDKKVAELLPYLQDETLKDQYPACTGPTWLHSYCPFYPACKRSTTGGQFSW